MYIPSLFGITRQAYTYVVHLCQACCLQSVNSKFLVVNCRNSCLIALKQQSAGHRAKETYFQRKKIESILYLLKAFKEPPRVVFRLSVYLFSILDTVQQYYVGVSFDVDFKLISVRTPPKTPVSPPCIL